MEFCLFWQQDKNVVNCLLLTPCDQQHIFLRYWMQIIINPVLDKPNSSFGFKDPPTNTKAKKKL